eukprot:572021-Pyramimonas_sp.AAC.1
MSNVFGVVSGTVSTLAGTGEEGYCDGQDTAAQFSRPMGVTVDEDGNFIVADQDNHCSSAPVEWQWTGTAMSLWLTQAITVSARSHRRAW